MPGAFPGDQSLLQTLTRGPLPQRAKRKRASSASDGMDPPIDRLDPPKKLRVQRPDHDVSSTAEHQLAPAAPVLSIRAPQAPKTSNEPLRDYERIRKLGESTEGKVYLMKLKKTAQVLAVKILKSKRKTYDVAHLPKDCLLHLNLPMHPHIIWMSQVDIVDGEIWQGLELCNGSDLLSFLERIETHSLTARGRMVFVVHVLIQLGEALAFLHHGLRRVHKGKWETDAGWSAATHAIIWSDIKPENLLLAFNSANEYGLLPEIRLSDSGHATLASSPWQTAGSPLYFCPEVQAADRGQKAPMMSTQSDIYTMGLTLYLMITGRHWRPGADPKFMELPAEYRDLGLTYLLTQCLQVNPERRPSMNCHLGYGLIPAIDRAWGVRDDLMNRSKTCDRDFWVAWRKDACKEV
jgi:serine/threonine protein kinase